MEMLGIFGFVFGMMGSVLGWSALAQLALLRRDVAELRQALRDAEAAAR